LAGAEQVLRIDRRTQYLRRGKVYKVTEETAFAVTSLSPEQSDAAGLLQRLRDYWGIETRQHYRRDHTQREDHCQVRHCRAARNLSLMRSVAIFLYEQQRGRPGAKKSLPDWQRRNLRNPSALIDLLAA
jgi:hypothetical protein